MKITYLICILMALFVGQSISAQSGYENCFKRHTEKGERARDRGDFKNAINSFIYASYCPDIDLEVNNAAKIDRLISQTLDSWVDSLRTAQLKEVELNIEKQKLIDTINLRNLELNSKIEIVQKLEQQAVGQRDTALTNLLLYFNSSLAFQALEDIQKADLKLLGLTKAFHALDTLQKVNVAIPPVVQHSFGKAVFANYSRQLGYVHKNGIIDLVNVDEEDLFYLLGRDGHISFWQYSADQLNRSVFFESSNKQIFVPEIKRAELLLASDYQKNEKQILAVDNLNGRNQYSLKTERVDSSTLFQEHNAQIVDVKIVMNGQFLTADRDGKVILWDENDEPTVLIEDKLPIIELKISGNGKYVLARTMGAVYYWPADYPNKLVPLYEVQDDGLIFTANLSPNGQTLLLSNSNDQVMLYENGVLRQTIKVDGIVLAISFSENGDHFVVGSNNGEMQHWSRKYWSWTLQQRFKFNEEFTDLVAINKNASYQLLVDENHALRILKNDNENVDTLLLNQHNDRITSIVFAPTQESVFLSSSQDGRVILWEGGERVLMVMDIGEAVTHANFINKGNHILSVTAEGKLFICPTPQFIFQKIRSGAIQIPNINEKIKKDLIDLIEGQIE